MSLRALAKVKNFNDLVMYLNFSPSLGYVEKLVKDCRSAVDLGFGEVTWLHLVPFAGENVPNEVWEATHRQTGGKMRASYALGDIMSPRLTPGCADAVLCFDVVEHFPKVESRALLEFIQSLARRVVVITLPNGFLEELSEDGNPHHLCGWEAAEFRAEGFEVHGIMGLKSLRGGFAKILRKPRLFWWLISKLSEPYVWDRPDKAFGLLAVKKKK